MYLPFVTMAFAIPTFAAVMIQQSISCGPEQDIAPQWESTNGLELVPINKTARNGLVDPIITEGLIYALGPRFANPILANVSSTGELGSCWACASTIYKESPCLYRAIKDRKPSEILECGVGKADLCKCVDCLPAVIRQFVEQFCESADGFDDISAKTTVAAPNKALAYIDYPLVAEHDLNLAAYRGELKQYRIDEVAGAGFCLGSSCGSCPCCLGACVLDNCIGGCCSICG